VGNRLSKIYTRTGDGGTTGLGDGSRIAKDSARVAAYGTVDEANSAIGLVLAADIQPDIADLLTKVQHQLFDLGGELCIPGHAAIHEADISALEVALDHFNDPLPPLRNSSFPAAAKRPRVATWRARSCAVPNAKRSRSRATKPSARRRSATSTGFPTCCSSWRGCWRARAATAKCCGITTAASPDAVRHQ
jgi:cob(I)alamin adenosyltransferase